MNHFLGWKVVYLILVLKCILILFLFYFLFNRMTCTKFLFYFIKYCYLEISSLFVSCLFLYFILIKQSTKTHKPAIIGIIISLKFDSGIRRLIMNVTIPVKSLENTVRSLQKIPPIAPMLTPSSFVFKISSFSVLFY